MQSTRVLGARAAIRLQREKRAGRANPGLKPAVQCTRTPSGPVKPYRMQRDAMKKVDKDIADLVLKKETGDNQGKCGHIPIPYLVLLILGVVFVITGAILVYIFGLRMDGEHIKRAISGPVLLALGGISFIIGISGALCCGVNKRSSPKFMEQFHDVRNIELGIQEETDKNSTNTEL